MANAAPETRWRLTVAEPFPLRCWEGDYVVYNSLSGDTHLLDIVSGHVLTRILESPTRASELRSRVAAFLEVPERCRRRCAGERDPRGARRSRPDRTRIRVLIGDISRAELRSRLRGAGVHLITGAFTIHVRAELPHFVDEFAEMYADFTVEEPPGIDDASVRVARSFGLALAFRGTGDGLDRERARVRSRARGPGLHDLRDGAQLVRRAFPTSRRCFCTPPCSSATAGH